MNMKKLIIIKIGGSVLTDKTKAFTPDMKAINRIAKEIHEARKEDKSLRLLVGHGGGSFAHVPAKEYRIREGMTSERSLKGVSIVQDAASRLNRIIINALIDAGENTISVQPSSSVLMKKGRVLNWYTKPMEEMLAKNILPVFFGDVVVDVDKGADIASTEVLINHLVKVFNPDRIVIAGNVDGVCTTDPHKSPKAKLISIITPKNFSKVKKYLGGAVGIDVTGGMLNKTQEMLELANQGFESILVNAAKPGRLKDALLGKKIKGTIVRA